jgi:hypothetical protein
VTLKFVLSPINLEMQFGIFDEEVAAEEVQRLNIHWLVEH